VLRTVVYFAVFTVGGERDLTLAFADKFLAEIVLHGQAVEACELIPKPLVQVAAVGVANPTYHLFWVRFVLQVIASTRKQGERDTGSQKEKTANKRK